MIDMGEGCLRNQWGDICTNEGAVIVNQTIICTEEFFQNYMLVGIMTPVL